MFGDLVAYIEKWPLAVRVGALFFVLWVPIVLLGTLLAWLKGRARMIPPVDDPSDWTKAVGFMLALGLPLAIGYGVLFALEGLVGRGIVVTIAFAVVSIFLIFFLLPRLNRW